MTNSASAVTNTEPMEGATNEHENDSDASSSESSRPLSPRLDDKTTIKDVLMKLKRRGTALPMPSTVARNLERRRKRQRGENEEETLSVAPTEAPQSSVTPVETEEVMAPQVTIDEDGNIVVDQASLFVEAPRITTNTNGPVVESSADRAHITSASFVKREKSVKWTDHDTKRFYLSLRAFGTDFSTMAKVFPHRTRKQLKLKYKREERENPERIDEVLCRSEPTTAEELEELFGGQEEEEERESRQEAEPEGQQEEGQEGEQEEGEQQEGEQDEGEQEEDEQEEDEQEEEGEEEEIGGESRSEEDNLIQLNRRSPSPEV